MGDELDFIDLEAELVEAIDPLGDPGVLMSLDAVFRAQLPPEGVIASRDVLAQMQVGFVDGDTLLGCDVGHHTGNVLNNELDDLLTQRARHRHVSDPGLYSAPPG